MDEAPVLQTQAAASEDRALQRTLDEPPAATPAAENARTEAPAGVERPASASPAESGASEPLGAIRGRVRLPEGSLPSSESLGTSRVSLAFVFPRSRLAADGTFEFAGLAADSYSLSVFVPGFEPISRDVRVEAGLTTDLELVLGRGLAVSGRVVDEFGAPLPEAKVSVSSRYDDEEGSHGTDIHYAEVDADGRFFLDGVPPGSVEVSGECEGWTRATVALGLLSAGDERTDVVLVLSSGAALAGRVLTAEGAAAIGAEVLIFDAKEDRELATHADDAGNFRVTGLGPGPFRAWAWSVDEAGELRALASAEDVLAGTLDLELRLATPGAVELTIHGRTSERFSRVDVLDLQGSEAGVRPDWFQNEWRPSIGVRETPEGLALDGLEPGEYWLAVTDDAEEIRVGRVRVVVRAGAASRADVALGPACELVLSLVQDGEPVLGSLVVRGNDGFALRLGLGVKPKGGMQPMGGACFPPGHYRVTGELEGRSAAAEVTLSGEFHELALELR
jgi:carboxypeptidase family protein